jgi:SHS family lactate transporter-like MFS transporter
MAFLSILRELDGRQRKVVLASFLGWTLDAFDYFLLVFVIPEVAREFKVTDAEVVFSLTLTLAMRPLGAFIFGRLADHFGRRPVLMLDIALFAFLEAASALAPTLGALLAIRAVFGIAMGGEWGLGASLALESVPPRARGAVSGLLQEGYAAGYLLGALAYWTLFERIHWRGMLALGVLPALLVLFIRRHVPESPAWQAHAASPRARAGFIAAMKGRWPRLIYMVVLMTAFNMFSHGSQDLYPTFLKRQMHFRTPIVSALTVTLNVGAIVGGLFFGAWSEQVGRKKAIVVASLLALPAVPLWAYGGSPARLALGVFLLQVCVQGAWGVVPVHLNELSPGAVRGTLPGAAYQAGNLLASVTGPLLALVAASVGKSRGGPPDYAFAMASLIPCVAVVLAAITAFGPEARGKSFTHEHEGAMPPDARSL